MTLNRIQDSMFDNSTSLTTNSKSVKGAINEVNASLASNASLHYPLENYPKQGYETDDGARINRAIQDINSKGGGVLVFKQGVTYTSSVSIIYLQNVVLDLNFSTLKATAPMTSLIDTNINTQLSDVRIKNGYIDATNQANWAVRLQNFAVAWLDELYFYNGTSGGIQLGETGASYVSYGAHVSRCQADRPRGTAYQAAPTGSIGIYIKNATDNTFVDSHGVGNDIGIKMDNGCSGNVFYNAHNWARMTQNIMTVGFDIGSSDNVFFGCIADTPTVYGFHIQSNAWRNVFHGSKIYVNGQGTSGITAIYIETGSKNHSFSGTIFDASTGMNIGSDFVFADGVNAPYNNGYTITGSVYNNVTNTLLAKNVPMVNSLGSNSQASRSSIISVQGTNTIDDAYYLSVRKTNGSYVWNKILAPSTSNVTPTNGYWNISNFILNTSPTPGGNFGWVCTTAGTACSTSWTASTSYNSGSQVYANGNVYQCTTAGTSGSTSPSGTGSTITDGSVVWQYISPLVVFKTFGTIGS